MDSPTFTRPLDPLVAHNPFRHQLYQPRDIPPFSRARGLLPQPVLPEQPLWLEMYWRAWELAWQHLKQPRSGSGFVANYLNSAHDKYLFMWDSAFMTQYAVYARRAINFLGTLDNFYAHQHRDGFICREIDSETGTEFFTPFDPNSTGPNILAWSEWRAFRHTGDEARLQQVFWPLLALHRWFQAHRTWPSGLYWATGLSSGLSNQPRIPDSEIYHQHWTWMDATLQASLNSWVLAQMANVLEEGELVQDLNRERSALHREINAQLWNEAEAFYYDIDPRGEFGPVRSISAYWALLDKDLVPEARLSSFLTPLHDPAAFNRPHRVPTMAADSPGYDEETGNFWRGGVTSPTNYVVLKGVRMWGRYKLAYEIARNHLDNVGQVFQYTNTFWENYAPDKLAPSEPTKADFVGWTGLTPISILLEDVIGIQVDWPLRRVTWDRWLDTEELYGVRNYPLGEDGTMDLVGDRSTIHIESDVPFTLIVRDPEETLQTAVPAGSNTVNLLS